MLKRCTEQRRGPSFGEINALVVNGRTVPIRDHLPALPAPVAGVIDRALKEEEYPRAVLNDANLLRSKLADLRYANGGAFRDALGMALKQAKV